MKLFSNEAPIGKGRVKVTVEYDATFIREMFKLIGDAPESALEFFHKIVKVIGEFEELS